MDVGHRLLNIVMQPIQSYLQDDSIQEIFVNHTGTIIIITQHNHLQSTNIILSSEQIKTLIMVVANDNGVCVSSKNTSFLCVINGMNYRFQGLLPPTSASPIFYMRKQQMSE